MDDICLMAVRKYIRAEYVIKCLELAGYTTIHVLQCVTDTQVDEIEDFVRHACSVMPEPARMDYVGPIFAKDPRSFRLPSGIRCGLLLAVAELKQPAQSVDNAAAGDADVYVDEASQTDITSDTMNVVFGRLNGFPTPPVVMSNVFPLPIPGGSPGGGVPHAAQTGPINNLRSPPQVCNQFYNANSEAEYAKMSESTRNSQSSLDSETRSTCPDNKDESIDEERLKQHSSASIIRLSSRQFVNGYLVRGRDFDLELEVSLNAEGQKRATGIFFCHLCRERRDRSSAVRFSIARNRYPIVSNVLSHLKAHFVYRSPMVSSGTDNGIPNKSARTDLSYITTTMPVSSSCSPATASTAASWFGGTLALCQQPLKTTMHSAIKQETVFPGLLSPTTFSPIDSSHPVNYSLPTPVSGEDIADQTDRDEPSGRLE